MADWTATEAARHLNLHRDTTSSAARKVRGARQEPRPGSIQAPWVASEEAWREWYLTRKPAGRPPQAKKEDSK